MKHLSTILMIFISATAFGQTLEGKFTYRNSYTSKLPNLQDQQSNAMMGTTQEHIIKGGNYKSSSNATLVQRHLFNGEERIATISANKFIPGVYVVKLFSNSQLLETKKLLIMNN